MRAKIRHPALVGFNLTCEHAVRTLQTAELKQRAEASGLGFFQHGDGPEESAEVGKASRHGGCNKRPVTALSAGEGP